MRRSVYRGLLVILIIAVAGGAYHIINKNGVFSAVEQSANASSTPKERIHTVEAVSVTVDTVLETISAVGTLMANESVVVSPEIAGRIAKLPFVEGDSIKKGDVLVKLDDDILQADLRKAVSDLTLAESNRERAMTLAKQGTGTLRAKDEAIAAFDVAQANVALSKSRLAKATITSPLTGKVGIRSVSAGVYVSPGDRIVEVAEIDPIKVDFRVPELALPNLQVGQSIKVTVDAFPGRNFDGEIFVIDPIIDANGRAIRLQAHIPNKDGTLLPGLFARVQIVTEKRDMAILIPEAAVFANGQSRFVYRMVDGRAVQTEITLGLRRPGMVEVVDGLPADAVVVTAGHQKIRDGSLITIANGGTGA